MKANPVNVGSTRHVRRTEHSVIGVERETEALPIETQRRRERLLTQMPRCEGVTVMRHRRYQSLILKSAPKRRGML